MSGFSALAERYGADNLRQAVTVIDWYTGTVYPKVTGCPHEQMGRGKVCTFASKLLDFMEATAADLDLVRWVLNKASCSGKDPTIYFVTTPKVLGYHLLSHPDVDWEAVGNTPYRSVEKYY